MSWLASVLCFYLAVTLSSAGLAKSPLETRIALVRHAVVPAAAIRIVAPSLGPIEIVLALWLVSGYRSDISGSAAGVLISLFLCYRVALFGRKAPVGCGCVGGNGHRIDVSDIVVSAILTVIAFAYLWLVLEGAPPGFHILWCVIAAFAAGVAVSRFTRTSGVGWKQSWRTQTGDLK